MEGGYFAPVAEENQTSEVGKFVEPGMKPSSLILPFNEPMDCRITCAEHPFQFYVVPWVFDKLFKSNIKKFGREYAEMSEKEIEEATPTEEFLSHDDVIAAAFYKRRWHRVILERKIDNAYVASFLDTGDAELISVSNIRRLYKKYFVGWPAMVISCSYLRMADSEFLLEDGYADLFYQITSINPNCVVTSRGNFELDDTLHTDVDVEMLSQSVVPKSWRKEADLDRGKYNLLKRLFEVHHNRRTTNKDLYLFLNYF